MGRIVNSQSCTARFNSYGCQELKFFWKVKFVGTTKSLTIKSVLKSVFLIQV